MPAAPAAAFTDAAPNWGALLRPKNAIPGKYDARVDAMCEIPKDF
jgi:hypothetical protein